MESKAISFSREVSQHLLIGRVLEHKKGESKIRLDIGRTKSRSKNRFVWAEYSLVSTEEREKYPPGEYFYVRLLNRDPRVNPWGTGLIFEAMGGRLDPVPKSQKRDLGQFQIHIEVREWKQLLESQSRDRSKSEPNSENETARPPLPDPQVLILEKQVEDREQQVKQLLEEIKELEKKLSESANRSESAESETRRLAQENTEITHQMSVLHNQISRMRLSIEQHKAGIAPEGDAEDQQLAPDIEAGPLRISLTKIEQAAIRCGLAFSLDEIRRIVVAYLIAMMQGQQVLFAGPPGSGKSTSGEWFPKIFDMTTTVISVRPGWLDSSDLIGYLDTRRGFFEQGPLVDAIDIALTRLEQNRFHSVVLDEMNIARVENYAADLLTKLEQSRRDDETSEIRLFSTSAEALVSDQTERTRIRSRIAVPGNLVVAGTLNHDRTTFSLSPKVKDRCLFVRIGTRTDGLRFGQLGEPAIDELIPLPVGAVLGLRDSANRSGGEINSLWEKLRGVLDESEVSEMHVSHRFANAFALLPLISELMFRNLGSLVEDLICMKLLPWIDMDRSAENEERLKSLAEGFDAAGFASVASEIAELLARSTRRIVYLE